MLKSDYLFVMKSHPGFRMLALSNGASIPSVFSFQQIDTVFEDGSSSYSNAIKTVTILKNEDDSSPVKSGEAIVIGSKAYKVLRLVQEDLYTIEYEIA